MTMQTIFIFILFAFMFALVLCMFYPFFSVILWSVFLYVIISPLQRRILTRMDSAKRFYEAKRHLLAAGFAGGTVIIIIVPLFFIGFILIQQLLHFLGDAEAFINQNPYFFHTGEPGNPIADIISKLSFGYVDLGDIDIKQQLIQFISQYSSKIFALGTAAVKNTGSFIISFLFVIFSLYFFYLDGPYLGSLFARAIPINPGYMNTLIKKFSEITRHLFSGYFLVALYQGVVAFILMEIFRVQGALLFSVVLMFCSFIPIFGAATVWLPVGITIIVTSSVWKGVLFLILSGFCISFLDNFLRPMFLKDRIKVHPLLIFFSILGGLEIFGFNGLLLGPMDIILFFTILDIITNSPEPGEEISAPPEPDGE